MNLSRTPFSRKGDSLKRILFLCDDNHLASRYCEEYFNSLVRDRGLNWQASSRALSAVAARQNSGPMAGVAIEFLRSHGVAPVNHRRLPLGATRFDFQMSDCIVVLAQPDESTGIRDAWKDFAPQMQFLASSTGAVASRLQLLSREIDRLFDDMIGQELRNDHLPGGLHRAGAVSAKLAPVPSCADEYPHARHRQSASSFDRTPLRPG